MIPLTSSKFYYRYNYLVANINPLDVKYFDSFASEMRGKLDRLKSLVEHSSSSGDYHEEIIREVLRNFLSSRFSVKTGFVFKDKDNVSNQIDILIVDENSPAAYVFQDGDFAVVIPEAVVAALEVKTDLNAQDFDASIENSVSVKRLARFSPDIKSFVFGYRGTKPEDENLDSWFKRSIPAKYKDQVGLIPDAIQFFDSGCMLMRFNEKGEMSLDGKYFHKVFRDGSVKEGKDDSGWHISLMLALLVSACEAKTQKMGAFVQLKHAEEGQATRLVQFEGAQRSNSRFSLGEGKSILKG